VTRHTKDAPDIHQHVNTYRQPTRTVLLYIPARKIISEETFEKTALLARDSIGHFFD